MFKYENEAFPPPSRLSPALRSRCRPVEIQRFRSERLGAGLGASWRTSAGRPAAQGRAQRQDSCVRPVTCAVILGEDRRSTTKRLWFTSTESARAGPKVRFVSVADSSATSASRPAWNRQLHRRGAAVMEREAVASPAPPMARLRLRRGRLRAGTTGQGGGRPAAAATDPDQPGGGVLPPSVLRLPAASPRNFGTEAFGLFIQLPGFGQAAVAAEVLDSNPIGQRFWQSLSIRLEQVRRPSG